MYPLDFLYIGITCPTHRELMTGQESHDHNNEDIEFSNVKIMANLFKFA